MVSSKSEPPEGRENKTSREQAGTSETLSKDLKSDDYVEEKKGKAKGSRRITGLGKGSDGKGGFPSSAILNAKEQSELHDNFRKAEFQKRGWDSEALHGKSKESSESLSGVDPKRLKASIEELQAELKKKDWFGQPAPNLEKILNILEPLSPSDRDKVEALYSRLQGGKNLKADLDASIKNPHDLRRVKSVLDLPEGAANVAAQLSWALGELARGSGNKIELEKTVVNAISTCNSAEVGELKTKYGIQPDKVLLANESISEESRQAIAILLKGKEQIHDPKEGHLADSTVKSLAQIALSSHPARLDLFKLAFQSASEHARSEFIHSAGQDRLKKAFQGNDRRVAFDYLNYGHESSITHVVTSRLFQSIANKEDISRQMERASKTDESALYLLGEKIAHGEQIWERGTNLRPSKYDQDCLQLFLETQAYEKIHSDKKHADDKADIIAKWRRDCAAYNFYKELNAELKQCGNDREVKTWEAQLTRAPELLKKLSACQTDDLNPFDSGHNAQELYKQVEALSRADWSKFRGEPQHLHRLDALLKTFASDGERNKIMSLVQDKIRSDDKSWTYEESTQVGRRATTDVFEQNKLGLLEQFQLSKDASAKQKIDALLNMSDVERRAWRDPKSQFHKSIAEYVSKEFQTPLEQELARRILDKVAHNTKIDGIDKVLLGTVSGDSLTSTINNIEAVYREGVISKDTLNKPKTADERRLSEYFSLALAQASERQGLGNEVPPLWVKAEMELLEQGHVSLDIKLKACQKNKIEQMAQIGSASEAEKAALLGRKVNPSSPSAFSASDQCRAFVLGYGDASTLKSKLDSMSPKNKQLLANDYYRQYGKLLVDDVINHVPSVDRTLKRAFAEFPVPAKQVVLDIDADRAERPERTWDATKDALNESADKLLKFEREYRKDIQKLSPKEQKDLFEAIRNYESAKDAYIQSKGQQSESLANALSSVVAVAAAFHTRGASLELLAAAGAGGAAMRLTVLSAGQGKDFDASPDNVFRQVFHGSTDAVLVFVGPEVLGLKFGGPAASNLTECLEKTGISSAKQPALGNALKHELADLSNKEILSGAARERVESIFRDNLKGLPSAEVKKLSNVYFKELKNEAAIRLIAAEMKNFGVSLSLASGSGAATEVAATAAGLERPEDLFDRMYRTAVDSALGATVFHFAFRGAGALFEGATGVIGKDVETHKLWASNGAVVRHEDGSLFRTGKDRYYFKSGDTIVQPLAIPSEMGAAARKQSVDFAEGRNRHVIQNKIEDGFTDAGAGQKAGPDGKIHSARAGIVYDSGSDSVLRNFRLEAKNHLDAYRAQFQAENHRLPGNDEVMNEAVRWQQKVLGPQTVKQEQEYTSLISRNAGHRIPVGELINRNILGCAQRAVLLKVVADDNIATGYAKLVRGDGTADRAINHMWVESGSNKNAKIWDSSSETIVAAKKSFDKIYGAGAILKPRIEHLVKPGAQVDWAPNWRYHKSQPDDKKLVTVVHDEHIFLSKNDKSVYATLVEENPGVDLKPGALVRFEGDAGYQIRLKDSGGLELFKPDAIKLTVPRSELFRQLPELSARVHAAQKDLDFIKKISALPIDERAILLVRTFNQLNQRAKGPSLDPSFAREMNDVDRAMASEYSRLKREMAAIRQDALAISKIDPASRTQEQAKTLNDYKVAKSAQQEILNNHIKESYDFDVVLEKAKRVEECSGDQPLLAEQRTTNSIADILTNGSLEAALIAKGVPKNEAKAWVGLPTYSKMAADQAGCDYLLINTVTGRIIPLDITVRTRNMGEGRIVESKLSNPALEFRDEEGRLKHVPAERRNFVIGVLTDKPIENSNRVFKGETIKSLAYEKARKDGISREQASLAVKNDEREQLVDVISRTMCHKDSPIIALVESGFPAEPKKKPSLERQYYELHRFEQFLFARGFQDWGKALTAAKGFVKDKLDGKQRRTNYDIQ
ncbi:MAG: hypothetical protein K2X77_05810 [Candidatus Obscuribacterales bacterium]|jgi:hypothetical protein|nr:hypothetical protein [Candidatus Obscuribacterales bacterium]